MKKKWLQLGKKSKIIASLGLAVILIAGSVGALAVRTYHQKQALSDPDVQLEESEADIDAIKQERLDPPDRNMKNVSEKQADGSYAVKSSTGDTVGQVKDHQTSADKLANAPAEKQEPAPTEKPAANEGKPSGGSGSTSGNASGGGAASKPNPPAATPVPTPVPTPAPTPVPTPVPSRTC